MGGSGETSHTIGNLGPVADEADGAAGEAPALTAFLSDRLDPATRPSTSHWPRPSSQVTGMCHTPLAFRPEPSSFLPPTPLPSLPQLHRLIVMLQVLLQVSFLQGMFKSRSVCALKGCMCLVFSARWEWPLTQLFPWCPGDRPRHHCPAPLPAAPDARCCGQVLHGKWL